MTRALLLGVVAACSNHPAATRDAPALDAAVPDAAVPDAAPRPPGVIDGACAGTPGRPRVLVYTYENLWRHLSNYYARAAVFDMCQTRGFHVESTNDPHAFTADRLSHFDVVVFAVTSGSGMDADAHHDLEAWIRHGGGIVGFEAAAATESDWPFFVANLGAAFKAHNPVNVAGTVRFTPGHPITDGLPASLRLVDQWYVFQSRPEDVPGLHVLMTLDESTLPKDTPPEYLVGYHALGWAYEPFGGRVFYTALGDEPDDFQNATILELAARGIEWAAHAR